MTLMLPTLPVRCDLAGADLAALLDMRGVPSPHSVRNAFDKTASLSPQGRKQAIEAGLVDAASADLSETGQTIADVLLAPATIISLEYRDFNGYAGRMTVHFPDTPAAGAGVVVNRDGETCHVAGFIDDTALSTLVGFVPGTGSGRDMPEFEAVLNFTQAAVLCSLLDLHAAEIEAEARRAAAGLPPARSVRSPFTPRRVADYLDIWWGTAPATRLVAQAFALALTPEPPAEPEIAPVMAELAQAGLLASSADGYLPAETAFVLARAANGAEASLFWERLRLDPRGERPPEGVHKRYLIGGKGTLFSFELLSESTLRLRTELLSDYTGFFASELAGARHARPETEAASLSGPREAAAAPRSPESAAAPHNFCEQCGNRLSPGDKFCTACGARIASE